MNVDVYRSFRPKTAENLLKGEDITSDFGYLDTNTVWQVWREYYDMK